MANDLGTGKSVLVLAVVAGCFAILWPNVFYPMITGDYKQPKSEETLSNGCCDVIFDNDVNGIDIMNEICEKILNKDYLSNATAKPFAKDKFWKDEIAKCRKTVLDKCGLNITELSKNIALGKDYKHSLDLLRTLNSSICLRESFGISLGQIGQPRRMRVWGLNLSKHMKPERPPHLHPEMMHPALREKGRAIQQSQQTQKAPTETKTTSIPGMRPTLGGAGHIVPPPKGGGTMGIVMPMYTIGIVIFFLYTMLKLLFKKSGDSHTCDEITGDSDFQKDVFEYNPNLIQEKSGDPTRLVTTAFTGLLQEVNKQISEQILIESRNKTLSELSKESAGDLESKLSEDKDGNEDFREVEENSEHFALSADEKDTDESGSSVRVIGMELTETCETGKWSRPETPQAPTPRNIYLPTVIPQQSNIIVTDSCTETISSSEDNAPVVLSGKVTLSLIGIQNAVDFNVDSKKESSNSEGFTSARSDDSVEVDPQSFLKEEEGDIHESNQNEGNCFVTTG